MTQINHRHVVALAAMALCAWACGQGADAPSPSADGTKASVDAVTGTDTETAQQTTDSATTGQDIAGPADVVASVDAAPQQLADIAKPKIEISALDAPPGKGLPSFSGVKDSAGALVKPADLKGKWTVIWFYPLASSFG